jgi:RNA polymerase sigma-70 factor (ECF subfamily)
MRLVIRYDGSRREDVTMDFTDQFESQRDHLRSVAYRMLGSLSEADDAVQEAWLRFRRADAAEVENMRAWLTVIVSRVCLDMLRSRRARREDPLDGSLPEPVVASVDPTADPEREALIADSVGLALQVVLETLTPAERLAFVLHDMFGLSFEEIAPIVERSVAATRQLASRGRRRVRGASPDATPATRAQQQAVIEAFLKASREGDFEALLEVLDPDVVMRVDPGRLGPFAELRGVTDVAGMVLAQGTPRARFARPAIVNDAPGVVVVFRGQVLAVSAFTIAGGRITSLNIVADPEKLKRVSVPRADG